MSALENRGRGVPGVVAWLNTAAVSGAAGAVVAGLGLAVARRGRPARAGWAAVLVGGSLAACSAGLLAGCR